MAIPTEQIKERIEGALANRPDFWTGEKVKPDTVQSFYKDYLIILYAIPALATLLAALLYDGSLFAGLQNAILQFAFGLIGVFLSTLIVEKVVEFFGGTPNRVSVLKLLGFSMTPVALGQVGILIPVVGGLLGILAGLYGIYLWWINFAVMTEVPDSAKVQAAVVSLLSMFVFFVVFSTVVGALMITTAAAISM